MSTSIVPVLSRGFGGTTLDDFVDSSNICTDSLGNVYMTGTFTGAIDFGSGVILTGSIDNRVSYLVKYDSNGTALNAILFNSSRLSIANYIIIDSSDNLYITGRFSIDIDFDGSYPLTTTAASGAGYVVKINSNLVPISSVRFDSSNESEGTSIVLDSLDNLYITGNFSTDISFNGLYPLTTGSIIYAGYVVKLNNSLVPLKSVKFDSTQASLPTHITLDSLDNLYVIGNFASNISFAGLYPLTTNATERVSYLVKIDNNLLPLKSVKFDSINASFATEITIDRFDYLYITGFFGRSIDFGNGIVFTNNLTINQTARSGEGYAVKLNKDLIVQTAIPINTTEDQSRGLSIITDNNAVYLLGEFNGTIDFNGLYPLNKTGGNENYGYIAVLTNELVAQQSIAFITTNIVYTSQLALLGNILYACGTFNTDISFGDKYPLTNSDQYSGYFVKFNIIITPTTTTTTTTTIAPTTTTTTTTEPICLPAGTPILTDQGLVPIDKIDTTIHTINNRRIVAITKTITPEKHLVCFEKYTLGLNIPSQRTLMTPGHEVLYRGKLVQAKEFVGRIKNVYTVPYNGDVLYNVLQEKHGLMKVNNMVLETLNPINKVAKKILSEL